MTSFAVVQLELQIAWDEFENALCTGAPDVNEKASAWWDARVRFREVCLERVS